MLVNVYFYCENVSGNRIFFPDYKRYLLQSEFLLIVSVNNWTVYWIWHFLSGSTLQPTAPNSFLCSNANKMFFRFILLVEFSLCMHAPLFIRVWLWTVACHAPLSTEFSRQKHQSRLPCPPPGYLPHPGIKSTSVSCIGRWILYH